MIINGIEDDNLENKILSKNPLLGIVSIFIYIVIQYLNRGKSVSIGSNKNFSKN